MEAKLSLRPVRVSVEILMPDGQVHRSVLVDDQKAPLTVELSIDRPPIEDTEEMMRTNSTWMIYKPGPRTTIMLNASGSKGDE